MRRTLICSLIVFGAISCSNLAPSAAADDKASADDAKVKTAYTRAKTLEQACRMYYVKTGAFPETLDALVKASYVEAEALLDPWKNKYKYDPAGPKHNGSTPDIWTVTPDGKKIANWSDEKGGSSSK